MDLRSLVMNSNRVKVQNGIFLKMALLLTLIEIRRIVIYKEIQENHFIHLEIIHNRKKISIVSEVHELRVGF